MAPRRSGSKPPKSGSQIVSTPVPPSTQWHRTHGRPTRKDKAVKQQYLTPQEEKALEAEGLRWDRNGHPWRVKHLPYFAHVIARQRSSTSPTDRTVRPPSKNWAQGFCKRNPGLKSRRRRPIDLKRDGPNIYQKVEHWFAVIQKELENPNVIADNVYNMDETGCQMSVPVSEKVLVSKEDMSNSRGAAINRKLITAVECISATGKFLAPLIVWPAKTHRSSWTTHRTPAWHFALSNTGYVDTEISLYWIREVFHPQTHALANGKPRVLINDGFNTHESLELLQFCFENNIILCRLPSHTSHKLQPCDVGVFGPLKAAYREEVDRLFRGGANTVGNEHFTLLYSRAREKAFTTRNIRSAWSKAGLFPFNPDKVLRDLQRPPPQQDQPQVVVQLPLRSPIELLTTPVTSDGLASLCETIERSSHLLDDAKRQQVEKLKHAAPRAIAGRDLLFVENDMLREQNDEKKVRKSVKSTVVGTAKVMSFEDLMEAQKKRDEKEADQSRRSGRARKKYVPAPAQKHEKQPPATQVDRKTSANEGTGLSD